MAKHKERIKLSHNYHHKLSVTNYTKNFPPTARHNDHPLCILIDTLHPNPKKKYKNDALIKNKLSRNVRLAWKK